jgi:hypothetical protein
MAAAGSLDSSATSKFLTADCTAPAALGSSGLCDLAPAFRQKEQAGWGFSGNDTTAKAESVASDMATI